MRYLKSGNLYCFSPLVMITTFVIEIACALYIVFRYKLTPVSRLAVAVLIGLAVFQLAEFNVCTQSWGVDSLTWARIGYASIAMLPPLGLHLVTVIANRRVPGLVATGYVSGIVFALLFLFVGPGVSGQECLGNYVIFQIAPWAVWPFAVYYYGWLLVTVGLALWWARTSRRMIRQALWLMALGYSAFIVPTTLANVIDPSTIAGIPSIMCGFAVVLALVLTGLVAPRSFDSSNKK